MTSRQLRTRKVDASSEQSGAKRRKTHVRIDFHHDASDATLPERQETLLLHAIRKPYELSADSELPDLKHDHELLVKVNAVGLNPIDWKSP